MLALGAVWAASLCGQYGTLALAGRKRASKISGFPIAKGTTSRSSLSPGEKMSRLVVPERTQTRPRT